MSRERCERGQKDLFKARLDQIIDMAHALVRLAHRIDSSFLEAQFGAVYPGGPGSPPLPTRLMGGLEILKHSGNLSDERLCEIWVENPYFQYFAARIFQHKLTFDRSSMTRWRQRAWEQKWCAVLRPPCPPLKVARLPGGEPVSTSPEGARMGEEKLTALLQESVAAAVKLKCPEAFGAFRRCGGHDRGAQECGLSNGRKASRPGAGEARPARQEA
jgi:hypothetical protein